MSGFARKQEPHRREANVRSYRSRSDQQSALQSAHPDTSRSSLTSDLHGWRFSSRRWSACTRKRVSARIEPGRLSDLPGIGTILREGTVPQGDPSRIRGGHSHLQSRHACATVRQTSPSSEVLSVRRWCNPRYSCASRSEERWNCGAHSTPASANTVASLER